MTHLHPQVPEFRRKQALAFPLAGMLALIAMATFSGVTKGDQDLAGYPATLSQGQLRALRFRADPKTGRLRSPGPTIFERELAGVDPALLEQAPLAWQAQVLGPVQDRLLIVDGKTLRYANIEAVSALSGSGRWPSCQPKAIKSRWRACYCSNWTWGQNFPGGCGKPPN